MFALESKEGLLGMRLKYLRKRMNKNQEQVARSVNISRARYSHYENNHVEPDIDLIKKLAAYFDVNTDYLLGVSDNENNNNNFINETHNIEYNPKMMKIPVLGHISAGKPILAEEHIEEYTSVPNTGNYKQSDLFMLKVKGDSMTGSRIYEGDRVLVKMQPEVENGEIAVVNVNGYEATLKKVRKMENGQTLLMPSNENYDPILVDSENARIIGKVIQVIFEP